MGRKAIPDKTKIHLWTKSSGRCQFKGCNKNLLKDDLSYADMNNAHIAHIIDVNKKTHRYSDEFDEDEKNGFWNLMLLCQKHHRLIDNEEEKNYSIEKLKRFKNEHENRILNLSSIKGDVKTEVICYLTKIGDSNPQISFEEIKKVLSKKDLFPNSEPIEIGTKNSTIEDNDQLYWTVEERNLIDGFEKKVLKHIDSNTGVHLSVFALAPQPLLIKLGTLIPDLFSVDVYQKHRNTNSWEWQEKDKFEGFKLIEPEDKDGIPILNVSLSGSIENERITSVVEGKVSIWTLTINNPNRNFVKHPSILIEFKEAIGDMLNKIKSVHGHDAILKVFPAMPLSISVEFGRTWMPKADMSMEIYDERDGFTKALEIKRK